MELTLNRPFIVEFVDRTRSSRPPREALQPASEPAFIVESFMHSPFAPEQDTSSAHFLPLLACWGD